jgi:prepilin peptidase CpaA
MAFVPLLLLTVLLATAAISDVRTLTIPNWLTLGVAILFVPYALLTLDPMQTGAAIVTGALTLALGLLLFAAGLFGGGDGKLLAATSLWAGPNMLAEYIAVVGIAGGILAASLLISPVARLASALRGAPTVGAGSAVPYGVALACGGLFIATRLAGWPV